MLCCILVAIKFLYCANKMWCRSHVQTTIIPVVVYKKGEGGAVDAHSAVYMSDDLNHSNNMVQHVLNDVLEKEIAAGGKVECAHVWSDGCAGQLKNKYKR